MTPSSRSVARLRTLLEAQGRALLDGDLAALADMPEHLDRALGRLMQDPPSPPDLARLATFAARNAELIRAAQRGIAQIRDRRIGPGATPLTTYDNAGRSAQSAPVGRTLSRG
jgi:hypothetical protein